jgi:hypothetical protein
LLLGAVATGYLAILAARPEALTAMLRSNSQPVMDGHRLAALQRSVAALQADVGTLKSATQSLDQREKALVERVGTIESRIGGFATSQLPAAATTPTAAAAPPAVAAKSDPRGMRIIAAVPAPVEPAKPEVKTEFKTETKPDPKRAVALSGIPVPPAAPPAAPIQTGSLAEPPGATRMMAVRLASGPSVDSLRLSWSLLSDRHKTSLKSLEPRYTGSDATSYQLIAGPVANAAEAQRLCLSLKARGVTCAPAEFSGDAL